MNVFLIEFRSLIKLMVIWSIGVCVLIFVGMAESAGAQGVSSAEMTAMMDFIPDVILALFGLSNVDISSPLGYFAVLSYYVAIVSSLYGVSLGSGTVYHEETMRTGEFLYTKPVARPLILLYKFAARVAIFVIYIFVVNLFSAIVLSGTDGGGQFVSEAIQLNMVSLNSGIIMMCISLFVATFLRAGHELAGATNYIVGAFFLTGYIYELTEIELLRVFSPLKYVVYNDVIKGNVQHSLMLFAFVLSLLVAALGFLKFSRSETR